MADSSLPFGAEAAAMEAASDVDGESCTSSDWCPALEIKKRPPTFREVGQTIRELRAENFQLKLQIYLEEKDLKERAAANVARGFKPSGPSPAEAELMKEFAKLREENERMQRHINQVNNYTRHNEKLLQKELEEKEEAQNTQNILLQKLDVLQKEIVAHKAEAETRSGLHTYINLPYEQDLVGIAQSKHQMAYEEHTEKMKWLNKEKDYWEEKNQKAAEKIDLLKEQQKVLDKQNERKDIHIVNAKKAVHDMKIMLEEKQSENADLEEQMDDMDATISRYESDAAKAKQDDLMSALYNEQASLEKFAHVREKFAALQPVCAKLITFCMTMVDEESHAGTQMLPFAPRDVREIVDVCETVKMLLQMIGKMLADQLGTEDAFEVEMMYSALLETSPQFDADSTGATKFVREYGSGGTGKHENSSTQTIQICPPLCTSTPREKSDSESDVEDNSRIRYQIAALNERNERLRQAQFRLKGETSNLYTRVTTLESLLSIEKAKMHPSLIRALEKQILDIKESKASLDERISEANKKSRQFMMANLRLEKQLQQTEASCRRLNKENQKTSVKYGYLKDIYPFEEHMDKIYGKKTAQTDPKPGTSRRASDVPYKSEECKRLEKENKELERSYVEAQASVAAAIKYLTGVVETKEALDKSMSAGLLEVHSMLKVAHSDIVLKTSKATSVAAAAIEKETKEAKKDEIEKEIDSEWASSSPLETELEDDYEVENPRLFYGTLSQYFAQKKK